MYFKSPPAGLLYKARTYAALFNYTRVLIELNEYIYLCVGYIEYRAALKYKLINIREGGKKEDIASAILYSARSVLENARVWMKL